MSQYKKIIFPKSPLLLRSLIYLLFSLLKGYYPNGLLEAVVEIIDDDLCNVWLNDEVTENMVCAGYEQGGNDTCGVSLTFSKSRPLSKCER